MISFSFIMGYSTHFHPTSQSVGDHLTLLPKIMARKKFDLVGTLKQQSYRTWDMLRKARTTNLKLGEETITDLNLLEMTHKHDKEIITSKSTKWDESRMGADWEWWLTDPSGEWLGFRIQAKVIDSQSNSYPHLHYKNKSGHYQSDLLISDARREPIKRIPLYCLYTNWEAGAFHARKPCGASRRYSRSYGCSLISAFIVKHLRDQGGAKGTGDLLNYMMPWYCLFFGTTSRKGLPRRALENWRRLIWRTARPRDVGSSDLYQIYNSLEPVMKPPVYVERLLEQGIVEDIDENLQYITIFQETKE